MGSIGTLSLTDPGHLPRSSYTEQPRILTLGYAQSENPP
jgi:hypothetical protein